MYNINCILNLICGWLLCSASVFLNVAGCHSRHTNAWRNFIATYKFMAYYIKQLVYTQLYFVASCFIFAKYRGVFFISMGVEVMIIDIWEVKVI